MKIDLAGAVLIVASAALGFSWELGSRRLGMVSRYTRTSIINIIGNTNKSATQSCIKTEVVRRERRILTSLVENVRGVQDNRQRHDRGGPPGFD